MESIIQAHGVTKRYGAATVVDGISFSVQPGECFGLLGPNGAGKSTTLRMITGLTPVDGGQLTLFGETMFPERTDLPRRLGVVPQEDNLDIDLTVAENLLVYGSYFGIPQRRMAARLKELLAFAQLEERGGNPVRVLSGGMKRRLVIARSLVAEPELVVLDEPTTGLDPQARHLIWQRLRALREQGVTLLLTTHYMEEAAQLCDRLLVLDHGRILAMGTPRELIETHVEPEVIEIRNGQEPWQPQLLAGLECRMERVGDTHYCYATAPGPILAALRDQPRITFLHRPANLEDVFLRLTGRDLRD